MRMESTVPAQNLRGHIIGEGGNGDMSEGRTWRMGRLGRRGSPAGHDMTNLNPLDCIPLLCRVCQVCPHPTCHSWTPADPRPCQCLVTAPWAHLRSGRASSIHLLLPPPTSQLLLLTCQHPLRDTPSMTCTMLTPTVPRSLTMDHHQCRRDQPTMTVCQLGQGLLIR